LLTIKTNSMEIVKMQIAHWEAVKEIYKEGVATGNATFQTTTPTWEEWDTAHSKECRLVAIEAEEILGWAALTPVSGRCVYAGVAEVSVYVATKARGKQVGKTLLAALIAESERENLWTLQAGIFPENIASIKIHEANGFRMIGTREKIGQMNGQWRDTVLLERRSKIVGVENTPKIKLLFVCIENSNRSQMAQAFAKIIGGDTVEAYSAGSKPSGMVNPKAIAAMAELGYDLSQHDSKTLESVQEYAPFDAVVTMGCGDACPWMPAKQTIDWQIPDPRNMEPQDFNVVRDLIKEKVGGLMKELRK
jgi:L-amino acid N-acyltransferase YncA/protein-tyrosine-phosphatase